MTICRICRQPFTKKSPMAPPVCHEYECRVAYATKQAEKSRLAREKKARQSIRERKEKAKRRADWIREAQQACNEWIRERDRDLPCISCGRYHEGQWHAGHYLSTGARPGLRFNPRNIWKQCQPCNAHLSGNLINYRINLIARIGLEAVERLESDHEQKKWTIDQLREIRDNYRADLKRLKKKHEAEGLQCGY